MRSLRKLSVSLLALTLLLGMTIGCSKKPNDDTIVKDIQDKTAADPDTKDSSVDVASKEGKVTLSGKVKTPAAKKKVQDIAQAEPGVSLVDDQTTVDSDAAAMAAAAPAAAAPMAMEKAAPVEKPKPQPIVIPAGTVLTVTTGSALSSNKSQTGQTFLATLAQPIGVGGKPAIPAGSTASGTVLVAKAKGKVKGEGQLTLTLTSISVNGHTYPIQTDNFDSTVKGKGKRTAVATGGGAAGGALIGGLAGGGKGAAIGAGVGAAAGFLGGTFTGNKQVEIPAESALSFTLQSPITLPPAGQ
jgi:hypothetical protein